MNTLRLYLYQLLTLFLPETSCFGLKASFLRWCGARIGKNVRIGSSARIIGAGNLTIGDDVWVGARVFIATSRPAVVSIGSNCDLGPDVMLITGSHEIDRNGIRVAGKGVSASIEVGNGCWLGARAMLLAGVSLPCNTLVAAGAVVTRSVDRANALVAGVPATVKR